jgi:hypothetical protein
MEEAEEPLASEEKLVGYDDILSEEIQDDYLNFLAYCARKAKVEGTKGQLSVRPDYLDDNKVMMLSILMPQQPEPPWPLPQHAPARMPPGISEEEAFKRAVVSSAPQTPPTLISPWIINWLTPAAGTPPPPPPPAAFPSAAPFPMGHGRSHRLWTSPNCHSDDDQ